jgi:hypothetical protein
MRKYFVVAILLALVFGHFGSTLSQVRLDTTEMAPYVPGEILVKLKKIALKNDIVQLNATLGSTTIKEFPSIGGLHIKLKPGESVLEAIERYSDDPNVEYAEPNYIVHALATPNDSLFGELWGLHNTGQMVNGTVGTSDADIDAPEAWDITTGDGTVVIAVIDSGVAWDPPNWREISGPIPAKTPGLIPTIPQRETALMTITMGIRMTGGVGTL